jgi:hypothetical protein
MNDDHIYLGMLFFLIIFGYVTRNIRSANLRKWISSTCGLIVIYVVSGPHTFHPITSFLLHTFLINFSPKAYVHWINFFAGFAYLVNFEFIKVKVDVITLSQHIYG